jgi:hypothetical protein
MEKKVPISLMEANRRLLFGSTENERECNVVCKENIFQKSENLK